MQTATFNIRPFCLALRHSYDPCMSMQEPVRTCNCICNFQVTVIKCYVTLHSFRIQLSQNLFCETGPKIANAQSPVLNFEDNQEALF